MSIDQSHPQNAEEIELPGAMQTASVPPLRGLVEPPFAGDGSVLLASIRKVGIMVLLKPGNIPTLASINNDMCNIDVGDSVFSVKPSAITVHHIAALDRAEGTLIATAKRLAGSHDYAAGFYEGDAKAIREIIELLKELRK